MKLKMKKEREKRKQIKFETSTKLGQYRRQKDISRPATILTN